MRAMHIDRSLTPFMVAMLLSALLLMPTGCGEKETSSEKPEAPADQGPAQGGPDMRGIIESTAPFRPAPGSEILAVYMVAALPDFPSVSERASVTVTRSTLIREGASWEGGRAVDYYHLSPGARVEIWFDGQASESHPSQALAARILIVSRESRTPAEDIDSVKDRHAPELMAIPGVVGVGIGEDGGMPHIVVMVVEDSPELRERIPSELEGYRVEAVVTGEIRPF